MKRGLLHIANIANLFKCDMTDLMQKQKPWENKLLKNPKKRIKQKIQERVQMDFKNKKELPRYIRTLEASRNSIEKEGIV